ncbi:hypothetical protein cypCar_00016990 [Cyprinus carpio]|nr:hypothetical protein cypCar_00016990 [Cyprinus carpio]
MIDVQSQQGVLLAIISLTCLGCVYGLCLCCRKKSSMRQEDNDLYDQDDFNQDGKFTDCRKPTTVKNGIMEPTYVDPIPNSIYANDDDTDSCNYVNWDIANEDDEPDYVNDMTQ